MTKIKTALSAKYFYQPLLIGLVFFIAIYIRIWALSHIGNFSWDEMFSFYYAQKPWGELGRIMLWETNPPLHLFLLKNYFYIFPATEFWARIPSALFGIATIPLIYYWTKKLFSYKTALITTIILALHPFAIHASALNRIYSILILLGLLSYYYYQKIFFDAKTKNSKRNIIFFILIQLFLFFSHLTFCFIVFAQIITIIIFARQKIKKYILLNLVPGLIWLTWFLPAWYLKIKMPYIGSAWFFNINSSNNTLATTASIFFNTPFAWLNIFFLCVIVIGVGKIIYQQIKNKIINTNFWIIFLPVLLTTILIVSGNLWQIKFFIIILPFIAITIAYSFEKILTKNIALLVIIIFGLINFSCWKQNLPMNDFSKLNNFLNTQTLSGKKQILVNNYFINWIYFPRYYTAPQTNLIYRPDQTDWDKLIVAQNYRHHQYPIEPMISWLEKIGLNYDEIIIYQDYSADIDLSSAMDQTGWKKIHTFSLESGIMKKDLIIYDKPETIKK